MGISDDDFVFGFVGSITGDKGINELLTAFRWLLEHYTNARLLLIGAIEKATSLDPTLMNWAKQEPSVRFCGRSNEVEKYMASMDCLVTPSYREGFGMTVIEAGAMALPVICADIPGPTDAIQDGVNGLVVEVKNAEALEDAMGRICTDTNLCKELGKAGLELVEANYERNTLFRYILDDRKRLLSEIS